MLLYESEQLCATPIRIQEHFFCEETVAPDGTVHVAARHSWPARRFDAGLGQVYSFPDTVVPLGGVPDEDLLFDVGRCATVCVYVCVCVCVCVCVFVLIFL